LQTEANLWQEPSKQGDCAGLPGNLKCHHPTCFCKCDLRSSASSSFPSIETPGATEDGHSNFQNNSQSAAKHKVDVLKAIENDPLYIRMQEYFMLKSRICKIEKTSC
jgi:hypothetical protein